MDSVGVMAFGSDSVVANRPGKVQWGSRSVMVSAPLGGSGQDAPVANDFQERRGRRRRKAPVDGVEKAVGKAMMRRGMIITERFQRHRRRAALTSLLVGFGMLGLKMGAYVITGSAAILTDALESVVHVAATAFMFFCFRLAALPPDANHPYGHGKAEYLSVGFEGGMILLAALAIVWEAVRALLNGTPPQDVSIGFWMIAAAAVINVLLGTYLLRVGRRTDSKILVGDAYHVLSDVWTSIGVLIGIGAMMYVKDDHLRLLIDSGAAIALALFIVYTASKLIREAVGGLLDEVDNKLLHRVVNAINEIRDQQWIDVHNLRMRASGDLMHIDFHLTVPGDWTIAQGHEAEERLEKHILERMGSRGSVMIHLDYPRPGETPSPMAGGSCAGSPITVAAATRLKD
jgi:cation diffusion facilitator family transporter